MIKHEKTLIMLKPAAFERGLTEEILARFIRHGLKILKRKLFEHPPVFLLEAHYPPEEFVNSNRPFSRDRIICYCAKGPVMLIVMEGKNAIRKACDLKGHPNPQKALPMTIRSLIDDTIDDADARGEAYRDLVHTADSVEEAKRQIKLWFGNDI